MTGRLQGTPPRRTYQGLRIGGPEGGDLAMLPPAVARLQWLQSEPVAIGVLVPMLTVDPAEIDGWFMG